LAGTRLISEVEWSWDGRLQGSRAVAYHNLQEAIGGCQVQRRIAQVVEVRILKIGGVVLDYALDEGEIIVLDGPTEADGHVDPEVGIHG
jgi:hypothetical protein